ncbi:MAG: PAS domain-containing protein [Clostridiales bacterium]|nr:PAS domain-containing protein [Candidatus Crickella merdequi]
MERYEETTENILENYVGGYRRCYLDKPVHMEFANDNLCSMIGYRAWELTETIESKYTCLVHPEDTEEYNRFFSGFMDRERCDSITYRMLNKDGESIYVAETMASKRSEDKHLRGFAIICDISDAVAKLSAQRIDNRPIAQIKVEGTKEGRIIGTNGYAERYFGAAVRQTSVMEYIAINDRNKVKKAIYKAYRAEFSGKVHCTVVNPSGVSLPAELWIERINESGEDECRFICSFRIEDGKRESAEKSINYGRSLLKQFAEDVYEVDTIGETVTCINLMEYSPFTTPLNIRMNLTDTLEALLGYTVESDRAGVKKYVMKIIADSVGSDFEAFSRIGFSLSKNAISYNNVLLTAVPISKGKFFMCFDYTELHSPAIKSDHMMVLKDVAVNLFGSFRMVVNGKSVRLRSGKAQELLALLIVKNGAFLSSREAIGCLWEETPTPQSSARYRKTTSRLLAELNELGIGYLVESDGGHKRIVPHHIKCDYYDYINGKFEPNEPLLPDYSWSEYVGANLVTL